MSFLFLVALLVPGRLGQVIGAELQHLQFFGRLREHLHERRKHIWSQHFLLERRLFKLRWDLPQLLFGQLFSLLKNIRRNGLKFGYSHLECKFIEEGENYWSLYSPDGSFFYTSQSFFLTTMVAFVRCRFLSGIGHLN